VPPTGFEPNAVPWEYSDRLLFKVHTELGVDHARDFGVVHETGGSLIVLGIDQIGDSDREGRSFFPKFIFGPKVQTAIAVDVIHQERKIRIGGIGAPGDAGGSADDFDAFDIFQLERLGAPDSPAEEGIANLTAVDQNKSLITLRTIKTAR